MDCGIRWVWSTNVEMHGKGLLVEMHFAFSLAWFGFCHHKLICILCVFWHGMGFFEHMLSYILCLRWHGQTLVVIHFMSSLTSYGVVNTCCDEFSVRAGMFNTCYAF